MVRTHSTRDLAYPVSLVATRTGAAVTETDLTRSVIDAINVGGLATVWRNHCGIVRVRGGFMHLAPEGAPDIVGIACDGRFVGIETKTQGGKTGKERSILQEAWRQDIIKRGGIAGVARSVDEALAILRQAFFGRAS
jgi:hypothetical protein